MTAEPVLIIGAGAAGLAVAAELGSRGVPSLVLERTNYIGSSWRSRYDCLHLNTSTRMSKLRPADTFDPSYPTFPSKDQLVTYLESFADRHALKIRFGVQASRIDPCPEGWVVSTNSGPLKAAQVIVAVGARHTARLPDWSDRDRFPGRVLHSTEYHNAEPYRGLDMLVVGGGCSGLDIAKDLARGGARSVRLAVKTQPMLLLKSSLGVPTDVLAAILYRLPPRLADVIGRIVQRLTVGDLRRWGLHVPGDGIFTRLHQGKPPQVVSPDIIDSIRAEEFTIVAPVEGMDSDGVHLADGTTLHPDVVIAATGFGTGLATMVGHLDVLDKAGTPVQYQGVPARPGLRFVGYNPSLDVIRHHAPTVGQSVYDELLGTSTRCDSESADAEIAGLGS